MLYFTYAMMLLHTFVGLILIAVILLQRGRGGGLAGAFGGMGGQSAFGTKAGDLFTKITIVLATVWIVLGGVCVLLASSAKTRAGRESFTTEGVVVPKAPEGDKADKAAGDKEDMDNGSDLPAPKNPPAGKTDEKPDAKVEETPAAKPEVKKEGDAAVETPAEKSVVPGEKPPEKPAEPAKKEEGDSPKEPTEKNDEKKEESTEKKPE